MARRAHTPTSTDAAERAAEVNDSAIALWKAGRNDEAARLLSDYLDAKRPTGETRLRCRLTLAVVERARGQYQRALAIHREDARAVSEASDLIRGKHHMGLARTLDLLGDEMAFIEYAAAAFFYECAGARRLRADVENNLAVLLIKSGEFDRAREHLRRALSMCPDDLEIRAVVADTSALIARAEGDLRRYLRDAASSLLYALDAAPQGDPRAIRVETIEGALSAWRRAQEEARLRDILGACAWNLSEAGRRLGYRTRQAFAKHLRRHFPRLESERRANSRTGRRNRRVASP